jgi:predicted Fe-Mo cluster-binding NifX family protein
MRQFQYPQGGHRWPWKRKRQERGRRQKTIKKGNAMKLCITSSGKNIEAKIDTTFGRAPYFLIVDTETDAIEVIENSAASQTQGAGIAAAQLISDKEVDALLTGFVGPNASQALKESGIEVYEGASSHDTVKDALTKFKNGNYQEAPAATPDTFPCGRGTGSGMGRGRGPGRGKGRCRRV